MLNLVRLVLTFAITVLVAENLHAQINVSGDHSPIYNGSDPWLVNGDLRIGISSPGQLTIGNGSMVTCHGCILANNSSSSGHITVDGGEFSIGSNIEFTGGLGGGNGNLSIFDGSVAVGNNFWLSGKGPSHQVRVYGSNAELVVDGLIGFWEFCDASLHLGNGAFVQSKQGICMGGTNIKDYSTNHELIIGKEGTLSTHDLILFENANLELLAGGRLELNGGILDVQDEGAFDFFGTLVGASSIYAQYSVYQHGTLEVESSDNSTYIGAHYFVEGGSIKLDVFDSDTWESIATPSQIDLQGVSSSNNATLDVTLHYPPAVGDSFIVLNSFGNKPVNGKFRTGDFLIVPFQKSDYLFEVDYTSDVTITNVPEFTLKPNDFATTVGNTVGGGLDELCESDDSSLLIEQAFSLVEFEVISNSPMLDPTELKFIVEGAVTTFGKFEQTIELYNFSTNAWELRSTVVPTRIDDLRTEVVVNDNPGQFISPSTGEMLARVSCQGLAARQNFGFKIDQAVWTVR